MKRSREEEASHVAKERLESRQRRDQKKKHDAKQSVLRGTKKSKANTHEDEQEVEFESGEDVSTLSDDCETLCKSLEDADNGKQTKVRNVRVHKTSGTVVSSTSATFDIFEMLKNMVTYEDVSMHVLETQTSINLLDSRNAAYFKRLKSNTSLVWKMSTEGLTVRRRAFMDIEDEEGLIKAFSTTLPNGGVSTSGGLTALTIHEASLTNTFTDVERAIDSLIADGEIFSITDERCHKSKSASSRSRVFCLSLPGLQACPRILEVYRATVLPEHSEMRKNLLALRIRTKEEYTKREQLLKQRNEEKRLDSKASKKDTNVRRGRGSSLQTANVEDLM